jgi:hypothetical protein
MRSVLSAILATSMLLAGPQVRAYADALPAFEFRGHRIGEDIETNFPYWAQGFRGLDSPYCSKKENGTVECDDPTVLRQGKYGSEKFVGDVPINGLTYEFFTGKLYSVTMFFYTAYYSKLHEMLVGKYGEPSSERVEPIQNMAGASFENIISEWKFREGVLKLQMRFGQINTGMLNFFNPGVSHEIYARDSKRQQSEGRKAF